MFQITITIGTEFAGDGHRLSVIERADAQHQVEALLVDRFGGFTRHESTGGWKDPHGTVVHEHGASYEVLADVAETKARADAHEIARAARVAFKQDSVLLRVVPTQAEFVNA